MKKSKWHMNKYLIIGIALSIGLVFTIFFSKCSILFALGSGIFGSALVPLLLEISNDKRNKQRIEEQKKILFLDIKFAIGELLRTECYNYSNYCNLYLEKTTIKRKCESIKNILTLIKEYGTKIGEYIFKDLTPHNIIIDEVWVKNNDDKDKFLCLNALPHYEKLLKYINRISDNKEMLLCNGILKKEEIETLETIRYMLNDIVLYSQSKARNYIIDEKELFFEEIKKMFELFGINNNQTETISYHFEQK